jgi:hypothetical protein
MKVPSVLWISILIQKSCIALEIRALMDIELQERLVWELEDGPGLTTSSLAASGRAKNLFAASRVCSNLGSGIPWLLTRHDGEG